LIVMHATAEGAYKDGKMCGQVTKKDIDTAKIEMNGQPAPQPVDAQLRTSLAQLIGVEICEVQVQDGNGIVNQAFLNGERKQELDERVAWIDAKAGYTVTKKD
jgi:hypothetical protein